ncbi:hypothetical protein BGZ74_002594, partial [Mortierella antarctica]
MSLSNAPDSLTNAIAGPSTPTPYTPGQFEEESDHEEQDGAPSDTESDGEQEGSVAEDSEDNDDTIATPAVRAASRKTQFRKFLLPECELILLRALDDVKPFSAKRGQGAKLWDNVELFLHQYDTAQRRDKGAEPMFTDVSVRACKNKWSAISKEHKVEEGILKTKSGITLPVTERNTLIKAIYAYE